MSSIIGRDGTGHDATGCDGTGRGIAGHIGDDRLWLGALRAVMPAIVAVGVLLIGGLFMTHMPPWRIPDVWSHIYRIDGILNGDVLVHPVESMSNLHHRDGNVGGHVDWEWIRFSLERDEGHDPTVVLADTITVSGDSGADVPYNNTATNSPVAYLPQLAGFALGRLMGLTADATYLLAETIMLVVYACCMAAAVSLLPRWRVLIGLVMLCPVLLYRYSFAISADSLTQALMFLFSCMLFRMLRRRVGVAGHAAMAVMCVLLAMCKFVYAPLTLLVLPLIWIRPGSRGVRPFRDAGTWMLVAGDVVAMAWLAVWMKLTGWFVTTPMMVTYAEMERRKHAMITDPRELMTTIKAIVLSAATGRSNLDRPLDTLLIRCCWTAMLLMVLLLVVVTVRRVMSLRETVFWWCASMVMVGVVLLIYLALWLQYTQTGAVMVEGMQHRYFLPLTVLGVLCVAESASCLRHPRRPRRPRRGAGRA